MRGVARNRRGVRYGVDRWLVYTTIALLILGLFAVYSASFVRGVDRHGDGAYFLKRQFVSAAIGVLLLVVAYRAGLRWFRWAALPLLLLAIALLVLTLRYGVTIAGATRWLRIGPVLVQPSEGAKLALVLFLAWFGTRGERGAGDPWRVLIPALIAVGAVCVLVMWGRDLGTTMIIFACSAAVLLIAGARLWHVAAIALIAAFGVYLLVFVFGYKKERVLSVFRPDKQESRYYDRDYQITHSLIALGSGGPKGVGLVQSREKYYYLPAPFTDFILSIIGEEAGFAGTALVIVLFAIWVCRGWVIAYRTPDPFAASLAMGIAAMVAVESILNIAVVTRWMPTTGTPLPFIACGGSSLVVKLAAVGILLSIHDRPRG